MRGTGPAIGDTVHAAAPFGETLHGPGPAVGEAARGQGVAFDHTLHGSGSAPSSSTLGRSTAAGTHRTTVLPVVTEVDGAPRLVHDARPRYAALSTLGSGGMGEVTLAQDQDIGRKVALKRLHESSAPHSLARFTEEVRIVGRLEHPNIVPIHDVGVDEQGQHFFVMKYVDGETLEKIIERLAAGDPAYVSRYTHAHRVQIAIELLRALQHAHENGVIHRDLKPANIMVGRYGEVMLMDWGLAKPIQRGQTETGATLRDKSAPAISVDAERSLRPHATQAGAILGTPAYMSPEQAAGRHDELDERSDLFSAAAVLFELFALRPLRKGKSVYELVHAAANEPITRTQIFSAFTATGAPAGMAHALNVALAHDPANRYESAAAMSARFAAVRDNDVPVQCHITFITRVTAWIVAASTRHPAIAALVLLALPLLAVFGLVHAVKLL